MIFPPGLFFMIIRDLVLIVFRYATKGFSFLSNVLHLRSGPERQVQIERASDFEKGNRTCHYGRRT